MPMGQGVRGQRLRKTGRGIFFCGFPHPFPRATVRKIAAACNGKSPPPIRPTEVLRKCAVSEVPT